MRSACNSGSVARARFVALPSCFWPCILAERGVGANADSDARRALLHRRMLAPAATTSPAATAYVTRTAVLLVAAGIHLRRDRHDHPLRRRVRLLDDAGAHADARRSVLQRAPDAREARVATTGLSGLRLRRGSDLLHDRLGCDLHLSGPGGLRRSCPCGRSVGDAGTPDRDPDARRRLLHGTRRPELRRQHVSGPACATSTASAAPASGTTAAPKSANGVRARAARARRTATAARRTTGIGCEDASCKNCVCGLDAACCTDGEGWDADCVSEANVECAASCTCEVAGSCCEAHPDTVGCDDTACQACVCALDPTCCTPKPAGTRSCADEAATDCHERCVGMRRQRLLRVARAAGCSDDACQTCVCGMDDFCCNAETGCGTGLRRHRVQRLRSTCQCAGDRHCPGDCDRQQTVQINELISCVNIALGSDRVGPARAATSTAAAASHQRADRRGQRRAEWLPVGVCREETLGLRSGDLQAAMASGARPMGARALLRSAIRDLKVAATPGRCGARDGVSPGFGAARGARPQAVVSTALRRGRGIGSHRLRAGGLHLVDQVGHARRELQLGGQIAVAPVLVVEPQLQRRVLRAQRASPSSAEAYAIRAL